MTRFIGEAVNHRKGRGGGPDTSKDRKKLMEKFLESGSHADIEVAKRLRESKVPDLPEHDPHRSFVFMDVAIANKPVGRLVVELFDDIIPVGATHLRNRCLPGSRMGLAGAAVSKLVPHYAAFLGKNSAASEGMTLRPVNELRAVDPGTVSLSMSGDEVAISLARALALDTSGYQVVGRVHLGKEVLELLNDLDVGPDSAPFQRVTITRSGPTNSKGDFESVDNGGPVTKADAIARLREESASARSAVLEALEVGLGSSTAGGKRKAPEDASAVPSSAADGLPATSKQQKKEGSVAGGCTAGKQVAPAATSKCKALDAVLGDLSGSDDSDSES